MAYPPEQPTVLIVDDEAPQRRLFGDFLVSRGYRVSEAASGEEALAQIQAARPDAVLLDVRLPRKSGFEVLAEIRRIDAQVPVLLVTAFADVRQAVAAIKTGAVDYLTKPVDLEELEAAIGDALGRQRAERAGVSGGGQASLETVDAGVRPDWKQRLPAGFICHSSAMRHVLETAAVVAPSLAPVLILGPSGAGKEMIARLIHAWSPRAEGPLVVANCAGLPETLIESELFGHTRGAFTGAAQARQGFFRAAHGGTLFLDEIGELPRHLQPKLLRAIESGEITPVGSEAPVRVEVRVVAATNRDLAEAVAQGRFRDDLYYRINVVELHVPPLAERHEDILPLARHFAAEFSGVAVRLSPQAENCLLAHPWPGNVRELRNAIHRACLLCRGDVILPEHLPPKIAALAGQTPKPAPRGRLSEVERATILATLAECQGNRTRAAEKLGISRRALIYKLRQMEAE